jgi:hypothetical protein
VGYIRIWPEYLPCEFEFLINLNGEKISKKDTEFRKAISVQERLALRLRFKKFYDTFLSPLHFTITKTSRDSSRQKHQEWKEVQRSGRWWRVTLHVQTCSGRNRIILLMRRPNNDSSPNKLITLPRTNFWYVTWSRVPSTLSRYDITVCGNVTSVYPPLQFHSVLSLAFLNIPISKA